MTAPRASDPLLNLPDLAEDPAIRAQIEQGLADVMAEQEAQVAAKGDKKKEKEKSQKEGRKNDLLKLIHEYQRRCIEFADRKATFIVFGANAFASFLDRSKSLKDARETPLAEWNATMASGELAIAFLAAAGFTALRSYSNV